MALLKPRPLLVLAFWIPLLTSTALAQQHGNSSEEEVIDFESGQDVAWIREHHYRSE